MVLIMRISLVWGRFLVILSISSLLLGSEVSGQCPSDQQSLLLQLKHNLIFNTSASDSSLVQWSPSSDCCTWDGVTCSDGRVVGLHLSGEAITGGLTQNSSLFDLRFLESLDLSFNDFGVPIPSNFGKLTSLRYLNLSNSGFVGQIPIKISHLKNLVTLDLSTATESLFRISLLKLEKPKWNMLIRSLTKLEELYLDGVNMSATGTGWCQAFSFASPNLRVLSLSDCSLCGPVHQSLMKLQFLSVISLDHNHLSAPVPGFIANFSELTSLRLRNCGLLGTFPREIFQVTTLETIDISGNMLLQGFLPEFSQNNTLQELVISSTNFSGRLPASIGNLTKLSKLDLSHCLFNGTIPTSMETLTQVVFLDLSGNKFTGSIPSFNMSKNLKEIILSHNSLSGIIPSTHWEGLLNLRVVDLQNNLFGGSIPSSLFSFPSLEEIQLSSNQFTGQLHEFPNVSSLTLRVLNLRSNYLEGAIPESIFELQNLNILSLSSNRFNGTIKLEMAQRLRNLISLDLSYNSLSVDTSGNHSSWSSFSKISRLMLASCHLTVFPNLKNHSKLVYLDLSDNEIHGKVPNWIWEVGKGSLIYLNLSRNYLEGMQEPYKLPSYLTTLDLHSNHMQGKIPVLPRFSGYIDLSNNYFTSISADISKYLEFGIFFSLSNNALTGVIPKSICSARSLQVLDLSNNSLSGRIPACVPAMMSQTLRVLNLRSNSFSGPIPDAFPANCVLKTMDLNDNLIQGQVPKSFTNCTALEVLDLGHNKMIGEFPCFLKDITTLQVLVLRSNRFHGRVGCSNTNEIPTVLQIVDLAHNNFSGKLPIHWLTKSQAMMARESDADSELKHIKFEFLQVRQPLYYHDAVIVTSKGLEMELQKILTIITSIDLSSNNFEGSIPEEVGQLQALYVLNLSNNALTGQIPSSMGNLCQLESLDFSRNNLNGTIPTSLQQLTFLSFLNLSFNQLFGRIPEGSQFQTFSTNSFTGNEGLCGFPLEKRCTEDVATAPIYYNSDSEDVATAPKRSDSESGISIDWNLIAAEIGFIVGFGIVTAPLFSMRLRRWYFERIDDIGVRIFPRLYQTTVPKSKRQKRRR